MITLFKAFFSNTLRVISKYLYHPRPVWLSCYIVSLVSRSALVGIDLLIKLRFWASDYVLKRCQNVQFQTFLIKKYPDIWENLKSSIKENKPFKDEKK